MTGFFARRILDVFLEKALSLSPQTLFKLQHLRLHWKFGRRLSWPDLSKPETFNEHILARKLQPKFFSFSKYADKESVKNYVKEKIGNQYIIPTISTFLDPASFECAKICGPCVIKATHLSSAVILLEEGAQPTASQKARVKSWFHRNLYSVSGEPQYRDIPPRVIVEERIGSPGSVPKDYKFFCWYGKVKTIQVDIGRFTDHRRDFFDASWSHQSITFKYPSSPVPPAKPTQLNAMVSIAEKLAEEFDFVRVDLYQEDGKIFFGELTFHPESGYGPFGTRQMDLNLGRYFRA